MLRSNRDRKKPRGPSLRHHRTYGSRIRRFDELNSYRGARLGSPKVVKKANGNAMANAGERRVGHQFAFFAQNSSKCAGSSASGVACWKYSDWRD